MAAQIKKLSQEKNKNMYTNTNKDQGNEKIVGIQQDHRDITQDLRLKQ